MFPICRNKGLVLLYEIPDTKYEILNFTMDEIPKKIQVNAPKEPIHEPLLEAKREELENTPPPPDEWDALIEGEGTPPSGGEKKISV